MKFKNDIEVQAGIKDSSGSDGTLGQVLSSTVSGVSWINPPATGVTGSGTVNFVPKWSSSTGLTNSRIIDNGFGVYIGYNSAGGVGAAAYALDVATNGTGQSGMKIVNSPNNNFALLRLENLGSGEFIQARNGFTGIDVFSVDYLGNATANSFIKIGGTSSQYLMADGSVSTGPSVSGYVPYTGANQDVNLGANQLKADSLAVSTTSVEPVNVGEIVWNAIDGTFDMGLIGGVTLQAGQEMHVYGKATQAIANGDAVMFAGVQGDHILIAKADPVVINANPEYFIGISTQALATNDFGYITVFGNVRGLNTTAYTLGSVLYYDSVTSLLGLLTPTEPTAPYAKIEVAAVVRVHATQGILLVRPHVMPKLSDIQDVYAPNPFNNDVLFWNSSNSRYETNTIPGVLGYNPERQLTFTSPLSRVSNTISIPQSTSTVDGYLSSTDWNTFNSKQGALNGTGFVKVSGTTVTYDNSVYALDNTVVKLTGNQTITGEKSFNNNTTLSGLRANNTNIGYGLYVDNSSLGIGAYVSNSGGGRGFFSQNGANAQGSLYVAKNDLGSFGELFIGLYDNVTKFLVDHNGNVTGNSFIKTGGTSAQILAADGSVITAGTGISISGGIISSTVVGGVTSFNTRTGAVTLTSTDVNTALGYTAANDANVVKLTGNQSILGIKSFNHVNGSVENFTTRLNYFFDNGIIRSDVTPLETINNLTSQSIFKVDKDGNTTANSFIKIGGNSTQYLKADGSVSTAMNSRIEVNFTATSGQTTFTTPYEVGQIDVYYNGSKLNPSEFTATNGTTVVLAQAATLNAQISIVKYVAALSTTAIRNETTFTATSGQTTFSVNYTVGQLDVFYNGSKLNVSEFTATNGTSVVLGFACVAGESVVFVSYVNQVSGASGTANRVAKFTGAATLGDSLITDNGTNVAIGTASPISSSALHLRGLVSDPQNAFVVTTNSFSNLTNGSIIRIGHNATSGNTVANIQNLINGGSGIGDISFPTGNVGVGATSPKTTLQVSNTASSGSLPSLGSIGTGTSLYLTNNNFGYGLLMGSLPTGNSWIQSQRTDASAIAYNLMLQPSAGNVLIGTATDTGAKLNVVGAITSTGSVAFANDSGNGFQLLTATDPNRGLYMGYVYSGNYALIESIQQGVAYRNISINPNGGNVGIGIVVPTYKLQLGTDSAGKPNGGSWSNSSDSRLKENIQTIKNPLNKICSLRGVTFDWIDESEQGGVKNSGGFIADEVMEVFPEWVSEITASEKQKEIIKDDKVKSLSLPFTFDAIVVESIKELNKAIQEQQAQIKELQDEIISLKNK